MSVKRAIAKKLRPGGSSKITKKTRPEKKKNYTKADMFKPSVIKNLSNAELMEQLLRLNLVPKDFKKGGSIDKPLGAGG